ncbi:porin family protein [Chryseolinea lacunae]|uniref:PorT family protein n=1 Tax=Chryseolinea lacunae TaxID=2801331 RepID=A0ABS1KZT3_9BACT|nr:porin family protein [Chryseolinea lacunae]MBL0744960.1 PorT family protein [Chryseolinea lacunae]
MKRVLYALLFAFPAFTTYAQLTSCTQTLRLARSTYEQGRLHEIPALLSRCLEGGFSQQEQVEAYKLLCLSYIYLEEPQKADEAMLNLLRTDHYFEISPSTDPAEFVALYRTFRTTPIYRLGAKLGANASQPNVVSYVPANEGASKYSAGIGFQGGVMVEVPLTKKFTLDTELNFILRNFKYENKSTYTEIATGDPRNFAITGKENQAWATLPVMVQYRFLESKFNPYIGLGASAEYMLSSTNKYARTKEQASSLDEQSISLDPYRNKLNASALVSLGAKLKVTGGFAFMEVRASYGLTNLNDTEDIYTLYAKTLPTGGYVDGIFKMNSLSVTLGYVYNRFHPKKLNK